MSGFKFQHAKTLSKLPNLSKPQFTYLRSGEIDYLLRDDFIKLDNTYKLFNTVIGIKYSKDICCCYN